MCFLTLSNPFVRSFHIGTLFPPSPLHDMWRLLQRPDPAQADQLLNKLATPVPVAHRPLPRPHHDPRERHHPGHHPRGDPDGGWRCGGGREDNEIWPAKGRHAHPLHPLLGQCEGGAARLMLRLHGLSKTWICYGCIYLVFGARWCLIFWWKLSAFAHF